MATLWHPPALRGASHEAGGSAVSWTELFYDLVFVVAIANLGRRFVSEPTPAHAVEFVALFGMLWWAWASITFLVDRYESDDPLSRLLAVAQMLGVAGFAAAVANPADLEAIAVALAVSYTVTRLALIAMYVRVWRHIEVSRPLVGGYLRGFGTDAALWIVSIVIPSPARYAVWLLAMVISLATPWLMRREQARSPLSTSHLPERFGLFTILVLGESVTAVVAGLHAEGTHAATFLSAGAAFVVATGLWWVYFDNFEGSVVRRDPNRRHDWRPTAWIYGHFPLVVSLTLVGDGMAHLIGSDIHQEHALLLICGMGFAGSLAAMALILMSTAGGVVASRRRRATVRMVGALLALAVAVGASHLSLPVYLAALAGLIALQIIFDVIDGARIRRAAPSQAP
ncbi:MAG: low temperature requirement protein A [Dehalococcoidia bacterium]|nr:MAG: low temperature requirement protein A [Dehalococcoidia bacterium]